MRDWLEYRRSPIPRPPSFSLFWNYRKRPNTDRNAVRAANAAMLWRSRPDMTRRRLAVRCLDWVTRFPLEIFDAMRISGLATKAAFGRGLIAQVFDLIRLRTCHDVRPHNYYRFAAAYRDRGNSPHAISFPALANVLCYILLAELEPGDLDIQDKAAFARYCRDRRLPHPRIFGIVAKNGLSGLDGTAWDGSLPPCDIFTKRTRGGSGVGANRWRYLGEENYADTDGRGFSEAEVLRHLHDQAVRDRDDILVQERLFNHPEIVRLCGTVVPSIRIVTVWNEQGEPEVAEGDFMLPSGETSIASNIDHGGINYFLDYRDGRILEGYGPDFVANPVFQPNHPATGAQVTGGTLPGWNAACRLAIDTHRTLPRHALIGWDFAYTPDGIVILEANHTPLLDIFRFFDFRTGELVAWHARRAIEKMEPPDSPWRVGADL